MARNKKSSKSNKDMLEFNKALGELRKMKRRYGGKMRYQMGGAPLTNATSVYQTPERMVDTEAAETQSTIGSTLSTVGSLASLIPGIGTAVGAGIGAIGGIVSATAAPTVREVQRMNTNPRGYAMGGELNKLSSDALLVEADNPNMVDSVETDNIRLDDNEVVTNDKVFTDSLLNPDTGNTFAEDEKINQKALGRVERMRNKIGDKEYKDEEYLRRNSDALFNKQEAIATAAGLRDEEGQPTQFKWGGKRRKRGYQFGGPGNPYSLDESRQILDNIQNNLLGAQLGSASEIPRRTPVGLNLSPQFGESGTGFMIGTDSKLTPRTDAEIQRDLILNRPNTLDVNFRAARPYGNALSEGLLGLDSGAEVTPVESSTDGIPGLDLNIAKNIRDFRNSLDAPETETLDASGQGNTTGSADTNNNAASDPFNFVKETPFGAAGTGTGLVSNLVGIVGNRPNLVDYRDIGEEERDLQNRARRQLIEGRSQAAQDVISQGRIARRNAAGRNFSSFQANLRNIASGTSQALGRIRGEYAGKLAQSDLAAGQRRTAIEDINRRKDMIVDEINTKELDAVKTENLKQADNIRKLLIEAQLAQNSAKKNEILRNLLGTKNFKFDESNPDQMIQFISELYK